jgi:hypothetical protein
MDLPDTTAETVAIARAVATGAHAGQVDKAGNDYISHPARVAARLDHPALQVVAWLHDVLEDTAVTAANLLQLGIPPRLVVAVQALSRSVDEPKDGYYARVCADPVAVLVKLADVADNSDPGRLSMLDEATADRLRRKYAAARAVLLGAASRHGLDTPAADRGTSTTRALS